MYDQEIILKIAADVMEVPVNIVTSRSRILTAVWARHLVVLLLLDNGCPRDEIAACINRTRTNTYSGEETAKDLIRVSKAFRTKALKAYEVYEQQKSLRVPED